MTLPIPPLQDVVRLTGYDVASTVINLRRYYASTTPIWGYDPSKRLARAVFSAEMSRQAAIAACGQRGNAAGRPHNEEVGGLIWDAAQGRKKFVCYDLPSRQLNLRHDFSIKVDPLFYFIENGRPIIFYLQPRRTHVPGVHGLSLIASVIKTLFGVDDLANADLLLLDLSVPEGGTERIFSTYSFSDIALLEEQQIEAQFQRFVDAYDILTKEGVVKKERRVRPSKGTGDDLFGGPPPA